MARQKVEQIQCDRCKRVELQPVADQAKTRPDFEARFEDLQMVFNDLCGHCKKTLENVWKDLKEWNREVKQSLLGPVVQTNQAAPLDVAPDYSPPKPHSAAGAKRN